MTSYIAMAIVVTADCAESNLVSYNMFHDRNTVPTTREAILDNLAR